MKGDRDLGTPVSKVPQDSEHLGHQRRAGEIDERGPVGFRQLPYRVLATIARGVGPADTAPPLVGPPQVVYALQRRSAFGAGAVKQPMARVQPVLDAHSVVLCAREGEDVHVQVLTSEQSLETLIENFFSTK